MIEAETIEVEKGSKEEQLIKQLSSSLSVTIGYQRKRRLICNVDSSVIVESCKKAYELGFIHLSTISGVDWPDDNKIELAYHLWSYADNVLLTIRTTVDRNNPVIDSLNVLWDTNAETCEREVFEMFGVTFNGHKNLVGLFLEDWEGPPPFRKDFDWREYVRENFYDENNPREKIYFFEGKQK